MSRRVLLETAFPFHVRANVYSDQGENLELAIHIDGVQARALQ